MAAVSQLLASPSPSPAPMNPPKGLNGSSVTTTAITPAAAVAMEIDRDSRTPETVNAGAFGGAPQIGDNRIVVIIHGPGQESVVAVFAEVLGKPFKTMRGFEEVTSEERGFVIGLSMEAATAGIERRDQSLVVAINTHSVYLGMPPDAHLSEHCDYEFIYTDARSYRRYLTRFISFTLGQISHHEEIMTKPRTLCLCTTFPDIRAALPNLDILTVGSDVVEIRIDLLREPLGDGTYANIPSLSYVAEQCMLLRQRTELPIVFTTRCTRENGRFPMERPELFYEYQRRAIKWGVEYIDTELWLPEEIRRRLYNERGNSRIMSAFHDFSGTFRWTSPEAMDVYHRSRQYADIIKMITVVTEHNENFELEYFRSKIQAEFPNGQPFCGLNMNEAGQFSRAMNRVFSMITHPLLPVLGAPGQMSAAEINAALALLGQLPRRHLYGITTSWFRSATPQAPFYEKCFNELGLPHHFAVVERQPSYPGSIEAWCNQRHFGGAYLDPGVAPQSLLKHSAFFATLRGGNGPLVTEAARVIGIADTILVKSSSISGAGSAPSSIPSSPHHRGRDSVGPYGYSGLPPNACLVLDNAGWRGILNTLTKDLAPSAYAGRSAVVLASSSDDAAAVFFAMKALRIAKIYTVGFKTPPSLAQNAPPIEQFISLDSLQRARSDNDDSSPFVIVSALGPDKSHLVGMLIRAFGGGPGKGATGTKKVFLDLVDGAAHKRNDPGQVAAQTGYAAFGAADVAAFTTVESLRLLVGQNVPYSFVRLASGRNVF